MITNEQALNLYELTQLGDNRKPPLPAQLMLWRKISQQGAWSYEQAVQAIIEFRSGHPGEYFEPGHVSVRVAELRKQIRERWYCPDPPYELADDPRAELEWKRRAAEEFTERNLERWTSGLPLEKPEVALQLRPVPLTLVQQGDSAERRAARAEIGRFTAKTVVPKAYCKREAAS